MASAGGPAAVWPTSCSRRTLSPPGAGGRGGQRIINGMFDIIGLFLARIATMGR
jgi:hypothetical protein